MKKTKRILAAVLSVVMILALVACGNKTPGTTPGTTTPGTADTGKSVGDHDGNIVIVASTDMQSFDPTATTAIATLNVLNMVYNRLFELDDNLGGIPVLAEKVEYLSDTELTIKIYEGIKFHDGSDMTSEDVAFSLERAREAATASTLMAPITKIEIVDEYTVKLTTDGIYPAITTAFTHMACSILPKEYYEKAIATGDWSNPVGSGRYKFSSRTIGAETVLVKNENYWNPEDGAKNESLTFKIIPEGANRTIMVETGEADLNINFMTSDYNRASSSDVMTLHSVPSATQFFVLMNTKDQYFSNPKVRQAINCAIDKEAVIMAAYDGLGTPHHSYVAPACLGFKDMSGVYSYDLEKAKALLTEAGYPNGFTTDLVVTAESTERIAAVVQGYLSQIGITVNITRVEFSAISTMIPEGKLPMFISSWGCYQDPDLFLARLFGRSGLGAANRGQYESDQFEELYKLARSTNDEKVRADYYGQIQDLLVKDAPWCPLFVSQMFALANKDLQGDEINTEAPYNFYKLHY